MPRDAKGRSPLRVVGPGLLMAATGVGAGDLYTAGFSGRELGVAVLWAVVLGAFLKLVLTEGLARWQLATGQTLVEGCIVHLGPAFSLLFGIYLVAWSWFVGAALMSACGVTLGAMWPLFEDPGVARVVFGLGCSVVGVVVVRVGGFRVVEVLMATCVGVMFLSVVYTAVVLAPDWGQVLMGLVVPRIPRLASGGLEWTVALIGGVGGTLTILCYGYWMREEGREGEADLAVTRLDLVSGYAMTMVFGLAMVVIGSQIAGEEKSTGATFIVGIADQLTGSLGLTGRWVFLVGAFAAVFGSLLGVWQSVPYLAADFLSLVLGDDAAARRARVRTTSRTYGLYLVALAVTPILGFRYPFARIQKYYAVFGALFMPCLAVVLLVLLGNSRWVGERMKNGSLGNALLVLTLAVFVLFGWYAAR